MFLYPAKDPGSSKPAVTQGWNISRYQSLCAARASALGFSPAITFSTSFFTTWKACQYPLDARAPPVLCGGTARLVEYLSGFKWTALAHIVSGALHRAENLVREFAATGLAEGFGKITGFRGMTAVQQKPKQVRGVSKAGHHHLRLEGIELKQ